MERKTHTIDAAGQVLGRLSSRISILLQGKHKPDYRPNKDEGDFVVVKNVKEMKITGKKMEQKKYFTYSGYLGGVKEITMAQLFIKDPSRIVREAVRGMLPRNRLRKIRLQRLKIE